MQFAFDAGKFGLGSHDGVDVTVRRLCFVSHSDTKGPPVTPKPNRRGMIMGRLLITLTLVTAAEATIAADVVVRRDDTMLEGNLLSVDKQDITLELSDGEVRKIARKDVSEIYLGTNMLSVKVIKGRKSKASKSQPAQTPGVVEFGKPAEAGSLSIRLTDAAVEFPQVRDLFNRVSRGTSKELVIRMEVTNNDERRIIRFKDNSFRSPISMVDDAGNGIRGIGYGAGSTIEGSIKRDDDINPGKTVKHACVFRVPPPKTEHLILVIDATAFGQTGKLQFKIPIERITGLPR